MFIELCILLVCTVLLWFYLDNWVFGKDLAPGPIRFPVVGNLVQLALRKKMIPSEMMEDMSKIYGKIFSLQIGFTYQVVVNDYSMMKEILGNDNWADRYSDGWVRVRSFGKPLGVLFANGESWKELRRFTIRTLRDFGFGRQKGQDATMDEELTDLTSSFNKTISEQNGIVKMSQIFNISVLNILWSMMAGQRFSHDDPKLHKFVRGIANTMRIMSVGSNLMMAFPVLRHYTLRFTDYGKVRTEFIRDIHKQFKGILDERRALNYYKDDQRDFIDVFLKEIDNHKNKDPNTNYYTDDEYSVCTLDLFAAGSETTSSTLEFAFLYMILNPDVQKKVQMEIDTVVGRNRLPNSLDKPNMPYTEATLLEIQRISNVVPVTVRSPIQETKIGNHRIPKGAFCLFNLHHAHMSTEIWGDPTNFRPERFLDVSGKNIVNTQYLLPFGYGKRICLGEVLARATLFTYFANTILQNVLNILTCPRYHFPG